MIITVRLGEIIAAVDTDDETRFTPEQAVDYLTRCSDTVMRVYRELPEEAPAPTDETILEEPTE